MSKDESFLFNVAMSVYAFIAFFAIALDVAHRLGGR